MTPQEADAYNPETLKGQSGMVMLLPLQFTIYLGS